MRKACFGLLVGIGLVRGNMSTARSRGCEVATSTGIVGNAKIETLRPHGLKSATSGVGVRFSSLTCPRPPTTDTSEMSWTRLGLSTSLSLRLVDTTRQHVGKAEVVSL